MCEKIENIYINDLIYSTAPVMMNLQNHFDDKLDTFWFKSVGKFWFWHEIESLVAKYDCCVWNITKVSEQNMLTSVGKFYFDIAT